MILGRARRVSRALSRALAPLVVAAVVAVALAGLALWRREGMAAPGAAAARRMRPVTLSVYESYPALGSRECLEFNGCKYRGKFSLWGDRVVPEWWVKTRPLAAVHIEDARYKAANGKYEGPPKDMGKWVRISYNNRFQDVMIVDACSDGDTKNGDCTKNKKLNGYLIDLEVNTARRLGLGPNSLVNATFTFIPGPSPLFLNGASRDFRLPADPARR